MVNYNRLEIMFMDNNLYKVFDVFVDSHFRGPEFDLYWGPQWLQKP